MAREGRGGPLSDPLDLWGTPPDVPIPGVVGRLLDVVREKLDPSRMDRAWIFPPLARGRKEWGLVVISCREEGRTVRSLYIARYTAELTGRGLVFQPEVRWEGSAEPDLLPRVMDGVVRRSDLPVGLPREVPLEGDPARFERLLHEYRGPNPGGGAGVLPAAAEKGGP